jgi:DNA-binding GntR family transcriptional regulator
MTARARESIAENLRRMVITGELRPGTLVSEAQLAKSLRCGRTPLREALQRLSGEHLVELPPRRGILIPELSILDFQQAAEAMLSLGSIYVEFACDRITDEQLQELGKTVEEQQRCGESARFYDLAELDRRFHTLLAEATTNRYFIDSANRLHTSLERFTYRAWTVTASAEQSVAEHGRIVEALKKRDGPLSKQRLAEHTDLGRQRILRILGLGAHTRESV